MSRIQTKIFHYRGQKRPRNFLQGLFCSCYVQCRSLGFTFCAVSLDKQSLLFFGRFGVSDFRVTCRPAHLKIDAFCKRFLRFYFSDGGVKPISRCHRNLP